MEFTYSNISTSSAFFARSLRVLKAGSLAFMFVGALLGGSITPRMGVSVAETGMVGGNPDGYRGIRIEGSIWKADSQSYLPIRENDDLSWITASAVDLEITTDAGRFGSEGFCIDPFHWSTGDSIDYTVRPLADGAKGPSHLSADEASRISRLMGAFYRPLSSVAVGERDNQIDLNAGLQIIIWSYVSQSLTSSAADYFKVWGYRDGALYVDKTTTVDANMIARDTFTYADLYRDYHVTEMLTWLDSESGRNAPEMTLLALQCDTRAGQDYLVPAPDHAVTLPLLIVSAGGLLFFRRRRFPRPGSAE